MTIQLSKQKYIQIEKAISEDRVDECQRCGNTYLLIWFKEGDDYNDFGFRHCPFCGLCVDEIARSVCV